jgi:transketolase
MATSTRTGIAAVPTSGVSADASAAPGRCGPDPGAWPGFTFPASGLARGAYVLADAPAGSPEVILIATGSEVSLALNAHENLLAEGIRSRVVSMPSWDIFDHQTQEYRDSVLPPNVSARVAIEQASTFGWERYVGTSGRIIGMKTFGASAPLKELQKKFGFEPDRVAAVVKELLGRK